MNVLELFEWASKNNVTIEVSPGRPLFIPDTIPIIITRHAHYTQHSVHIDLVHSEIESSQRDVIREALDNALIVLNIRIEHHKELIEEEQRRKTNIGTL